MKDNLSPEEKLLRLIKGQKEKSGETKSLAKSPPEASVRTAALEDFFSGINLQRLIWIAFILGCAYLFYLLFYPLSAFKEKTFSQGIAGGGTEVILELDTKKQPIDFYRQEIAKHSIFFNSGRESASGEGHLSGVDVNVTKDINLVGIISGEPAQAIIEDAKTKKTYYLTKGQFIGELEVKDIREGKIILNYNGHDYELYL